MLGEGETVAMATELLGVRGSGECYQVLDRWLPRALHFDHYNYLLADVRTRSHLRHGGPGAGSYVYADQSAEDAWGDVVVDLVRTAAPGSSVRLDDLKARPDRPEGFEQVASRIADACGFVDSIAIFLYFSKERDRGLALILWRARPGPAFDAEDVAAIRVLGPMLSAAFTRSIEDEYERLSQGIPAQVLAGADQFAFLVSKDGSPLVCDGQLKTCLSSVFGGPRNAAQLPKAFKTLVAGLIRSLEMNPVQGIATAEFAKKDRRCRLYLSRVESTPDGAPVFKVLVDCNPGTFSLTLLREAGLSEFQVKIVELLQCGGHSATIAEAFNVSLGDLNYHLREIGEKIYADGRTEIVARALTLHHEISIRRGFAGFPGVNSDAPGPCRCPAGNSIRSSPVQQWWQGRASPVVTPPLPAKGPMAPDEVRVTRRPEVST